MSLDQAGLRVQLLQLMRRPRYAPLRKRALARQLEIDDDDYVDFRHYVDELVEQGTLAELKHGKYGLRTGPPAVPLPRTAGGRTAALAADLAGPDAQVPREALRELPKHCLLGRVEIKRAGFGFLLSDPPGHDLYLSPEDLGGALSGDLVAVVHKRRGPARGGRGPRAAGRVIRVLERAHALLVGTFYETGLVVPDTRGVFTEIAVLPADRGEAHDGDKVALELFEAAERNRPGARPLGRIVKVYGEAGEARAEIQAIVENFSLHTEFPPEALGEAEALPEELPAEELAVRVDYTTPVTFTIDPEDAKDHDDAVALRDLGDGRVELLVHIADVSHYIPEDSAVDREARERGTSVYLPGWTLPMLPPRLSSHLCSLTEGDLRLTKTAAITFSKNLHPVAVRLERSYIRSEAFLTYEQVKQAVEEERPGLVRSPEVYAALVRMREFSQALRRERLESGALDLDLPEVRLVLDDEGAVTGFAKQEHHWAHQLIEEFMLAANRAVAEYLVENEVPGLFRTHEEPEIEDLRQFAEFVREYGVPLRPPFDRFKLKSVLDRVAGKPFQEAVHFALLTSLKQAQYAAECMPHYALNFGRYLHFTSPIRRYPDLVVHRALQERFEPGEKVLPQRGKKHGGGAAGQAHYRRLAALRPLAVHCSHREREADAAEEEVKKVRQIQYLRANMRESHPGVITRVREFGLFVELRDCYVEGLVRVQDLGDDYYEYHEAQHLLQGRRTGRGFRLGDQVSVRVVHIDLGRRQVGLVLV